jgi:hypothetical protein
MIQNAEVSADYSFIEIFENSSDLSSKQNFFNT